MKWKGARAMLKMLSDVVTKLYAGDGLQSVVDADSLAKAAGAAQGFLPRLGVIVQQSDEILQHLATQSTDLTSEDFDALDIATASEVIAQAFAINFDAELKNSWGNVVGVVQALMLPKAKTN